MNRDGFALVTVLWFVIAATAVVGLGIAPLHVTERASRNRIALGRGRWAAEACLAIAQSRLQTRARSDTATVDLGRSVRCSWRLHDPTSRINVNVATVPELIRLQEALGMAGHRASQTAQAIVAQQRTGSIADLDEITHEFAIDERVVRHLTVDGPGLVNAASAPAAVLLALAGMSTESMEAVVRHRQQGQPVQTLDALAGSVSPAAGRLLAESYAELTRRMTFDTSIVVVTAEGWVESVNGDLRARIELMITRLPDRLAVVRRRAS